MKTYRIKGKTNGWIAQRDSLFKGKTEVVLADGLSLKEAQNKLIEFYREDYANEAGMWVYSNNWGLFRIHDNRTWSYPDGTRGYEYDSRYFEIEEEEK